MKKLFNYKTLLTAISLIFLATSAFVLINTNVHYSTKDYIYQNLENVPSRKTGLVLGALVYSDGGLSDMVKDRCDTAFELYKSGKIQKILVSGDHGQVEYDEVNTMKNYLLKKGVKPEDLFMDHAGFDTYDSLYRARDIFKADSLIIITQEFHLPRAVYIAKLLGIDAVGIKADKTYYAGGTSYNEFREKFSNIKANLDILLQNKPKYLGDVISIDGDSRMSWD